MTDSLTALLLRLSDAGPNATISGRAARPYLGRTLDRLLASGVLDETAEATEWSPCADCDCAFGFRPIRALAGRIVAACPIDPGSDLELDPEDLREFRIDAGRLLSLIGAASGLSGRVEVIAPGLWHLGRLGSGRGVAVALPARSLRMPGALLLLKNGGGPVTVLASNPDQTTRLRLFGAGIDFVELKASLRPGSGILDRLDPPLLEPGSFLPRLRIIVQEHSVRIDGLSQRVAAQPFRLLTLLAQHRLNGTGPVRNREIEDATGRDARDLVRELRDTLSAGRANGSELRDWIVARRSLGAFELVLEPEQIEIAP